MQQIRRLLGCHLLVVSHEPNRVPPGEFGDRLANQIGDFLWYPHLERRASLAFGGSARLLRLLFSLFVQSTPRPVW
jgi:hypothetical protein